MAEIEIDKRIKHPEDPHFGEKITENSNENKMEDFITASRNEPSLIEQKSIHIKKPETEGRFTKLDKDQLRLEGLSFDISNEDAVKIFEQITSIMTDPLTVASLFKELDTELGDLIKKNGIEFKKNDQPQFLITGKGNYVPGPPPDDYHPKKKARLLDELLLAREVKNQINKDGKVPKFVGFVDSIKADPLVASGYIFTEDKQISRLLLHGSFTHRLMFDALCHAANTGKLNLQYGDGKVLTPQQLLELLVLGKYYRNFLDYTLNRNPFGLWTLTIDTIADMHNSLDPDQYNFSCRSPFVLNSLFLCFGEELGLANLQHYLLDSHWKAAYEMVHRVKQSNTADNIADSQIYTYCMEALSTTEGEPGQVEMKLPFTLNENESRLNPTYEPFDEISPPGIVQKKSRAIPSKGEYASWNEFFDRKKEKHATMFAKAVLPEQKIETKSEPETKEKPKVEFKPEIKAEPTPTFSPKKEESVVDIWNNINEHIKQNRPALLEAELQKFKPSLSSLISSLYILAATHRAEACLRTLVDAGLDINAVDKDHKTAWMLAGERSDDEGMKLLERAGATIAKKSEVNKMWEGMQKNDAALFQEGLQELEQRVKPMPFLMTFYYDQVVSNGADECLRVLIEAGWDINAIDEKNKTPLMLANDRSDYEGMLMLIKAGAKIYSPIPSQSGFLKTPGWEPTSSSLAINTINQLKDFVFNSDDSRLIEAMQAQLTKKSNAQQLIIILLDYLVRNKSLTLSNMMKSQIKNALNGLLQEKEKEPSWKPSTKT